jgi:DNA polymerase-1
VGANHLQKARELIARKKGKVAAEPVFIPEENDHSTNGYLLQKSYEEIRSNSTKPISSLPKTPSSRVEITREDLVFAGEELGERYPNLVYRDEDLEEVRRWIRTVDEVSLDIETRGSSRTLPLYRKEALSFIKGKVRLIQLAGDEKTYYLDVELLDRALVAELLEELRGTVLYVHNGIFDLPRIKRAFGVDLMGEEIRDTLVLSRLVRAGEWEPDASAKSGMSPYRHAIKDVLSRELGVEIPKDAPVRWDVPLTEEHLVYAGDDVEHLPRLYRALEELAGERGLAPGLELLKTVYPLYMRQQYRGVPLDKDRFDELQRKIKSKIEDARHRLEELAPEHPAAAEGARWSWGNKQSYNEEDPSIGPGRNGARRALSIAGVELPNLKKPTRLEYLKKKSRPSHNLVEALHDYYIYSDLQSDCKNWIKYSYEDGRLYPNVKFVSQETGRSAYADPPIQNTPKVRDEELGASLRDCIRAPAGAKIVKADYAAQELRILAHLAGDTNLVESFTEGRDPHLVVGEHVAGHALDRATEEGEKYRKLGKRANYGFSYGAGPMRYATSVYEDTSARITQRQARAEQRAFREAWPGVYRWQQHFGARDGTEPDAWFTTSYLGRRRYVGIAPRDGAPNYCDRLNGPIQAGGADMLYLALARLAEDKNAGVLPEEAEIIFTTHDEIVLEVPDAGAERARRALVERMREAMAELLGDELASEDCVEGEESPSWGGG